MSADNLELVKTSKHYDFWQNLKQGWDWFETHSLPPNVEVQNGEYVFESLTE